MSGRFALRIAMRTALLVLLLGFTIWAQPSPAHFVLHSGRGLGGPIAFSPDGRILASAGAYGIQLIDVSTRREIKFLPNARDSLRVLLFSPDGRWLVAGKESSKRGQMHRIEIWDVQETKLSRELVRHRFPVVSLAFSADGRTLLSAGDNATVIQWDWQTGRLLRIVSHPTAGIVQAVILSPNGKWLAEVSGIPDGTRGWLEREVKTYEAVEKRVVSEFTGSIGFTEEVASIVFSPEGRWFAVNGIAWDLKKFAAKENAAPLLVNGYFLAFTEQGTAFAQVYGLGDGTFAKELRDLSGVKPSVVLDNRPGWPAVAEFSRDGEKLAYVRNSGTSSLLLWDLLEMREMGEVVGPPDAQVGEPLEPAAFSPNGSELAVATNSGEIWIWEPTKQVVKKRLRGDCSPFHKVRFSPHGDRLAAGCNLYGHGVQVWDLAQEAVAFELKEARSHFAFTPDGKQIAWLSSNGPDAVLNFTDLQTGALLRSLRGPGGDFQFTPGGTHIVGELAEGDQYGWSGALAIWDAGSGLRQVRIRDGGHFAISPDGSVLATGSWLYRTATGEQIRRYTTRSGFVHSLAFSPDGRWLAAGWTDNGTSQTEIVVWDTNSWQEVAQLSGHAAEVTQLVFSPDGRQLVSTSYDRTVRVWRLGDLERPKQ